MVGTLVAGAVRPVEYPTAGNHEQASRAMAMKASFIGRPRFLPTRWPVWWVPAASRDVFAAEVFDEPVPEIGVFAHAFNGLTVFVFDIAVHDKIGVAGEDNFSFAEFLNDEHRFIISTGGDDGRIIPLHRPGRQNRTGFVSLADRGTEI